MLAYRPVAWKVPTPTKGTPGTSHHLQSAVARRESEFELQLSAVKWDSQEAASLAVAEVRTKFEAKQATGAEERRALKTDLRKMTIVAQAARERYERAVVALEDSMENVAALLELLNAGVPQEEGETPSRSEEEADMIWDDFEALWCKH